MNDLSKEESWKTLSVQEHYKNERFRIMKEKFVTPRKTEGLYYVLEANDGVKIVALDGDDILFIEEYRYPVEKRIMEVPGGGVSKGEDIETSAKRELLEEIGATAESWLFCKEMYVLPGLVRTKCYVFLAKDLTFSERILDDTEADSTVIRINKKEVYRLLDSGEIENSLSASVLLAVRKYMDL